MTEQPPVDSSSVWQHVITSLESSELSPRDRAYLGLTRFVGLLDGTALLAVPYPHTKDVLETSLRQPIVDALSTQLDQEVRLAITVDDALREQLAAETDEPADAPEASGTAYPKDALRLARLRDDPAPGTRAAFLGMLDAALPLKRVIVQGLVHDGAGRLLLCELTYKRDWDLVGGVAEPAESPVDSLVREIDEELGVHLPVGDLLAVDWLPPYRQWRDALLLVFDLGVHPDLAGRAVLQPSELAAVHWCTVEEAEAHVAPYVHRLLVSLRDAQRAGEGPVFLEDGVVRGSL